MASSKNKLFGHGTEVTYDPSMKKMIRPGSRIYPTKGTLYELSADGSNSYRKIAEVQGLDGVSNLFVNASATMIGYENTLLPAGVQEKKYHGSGHIHVDDEQELLMIHDVSSGELIRKLNLSDEFHLCFIPYLGWLPAKDLIYFQVVQNSHTPRSCDKKAGYYTINQDGSARKKFSPFSTKYPVEILVVLPTAVSCFDHCTQLPNSFYSILLRNPKKNYRFTISASSSGFQALGDIWRTHPLIMDTTASISGQPQHTCGSKIWRAAWRKRPTCTNKRWVNTSASSDG